MKLTITITCDNAAFEDNPTELADILRSIAASVKYDGSIGAVSIKDSNGNTVGAIAIEE